MKKLVALLIVLSLLLLIGILLSMMPTNTHAATLADYRKFLKQYKI